ncbi:hypothetical protein [Haloarcula marina]|uniref:hypothetical protein n=1 Tax=Haloarcula marina TaxID=2961574 RepID=UPI0020B7966A|nr:hypothetical protein [Halomicroarcula marina]
MAPKLVLLVVGTLLVIVGFFVALGAIIAQIPICGPGGNCAQYDYLAAAGGITVGVVIAGGGGWLIRSGRKSE